MATTTQIQEAIDNLPEGQYKALTVAMLKNVLTLLKNREDVGGQGAQGPQGPQGETGEQGETGPQGLPGSGGLSETDSETIIHILLTGQSNSDGRGLNSDATTAELASQSSCEIWNKASNSYIDLNVGAGNNNLSSSNFAGRHGIELGLAKHFQTYFPGRKLRLIKQGSSGTPIANHLPSGAEYTDFWTNHVQPAIAQTISEGKKAEVYLVFIQGEADSGNQTDVDAYPAQLTQWVDQWKSNLGHKLEIRQVEIGESETFDEGINAALYGKANQELHYDVVRAHDVPTYPDLVHYNYKGLKIISERVLKDMTKRRSRCIIQDSRALV